MKIRLGMEKLDMARIAEYCSGEIYDFTGALGCEFEYICTDSREADDKTMFVATRGERVDGHDYIISAIDKGCRCILCEYVPSDIVGKKACFVVVENSIEAFSHAARGYRTDMRMKTVAITGSVGKTTTKELCAAIIREKYKLYSTVGNFNSIIGMPMSLMEADRGCEAAVFEMGMSGFGEISPMSLCARPHVAMVTNIGSSHLEYLKTRENIAKAKLEIADGLDSDGYLLLMGDEPILRGEVIKKYAKKCNILYVGTNKNDENDALVENIRVEGDKTLFDLYFGGEKYENLEISAIGRHFAINGAFAAIAALLIGCDERDIRAGLSAYAPSGMRQNISDRNGVRLIADCYNAAPESMRASLEVLRGIQLDGKRIAVLGDMRELGANSDELHREVGKFAAECTDMLFTLGQSGALIAEGAILGGLDKKKVASFLDGEEIDALVGAISENLAEGDAILFKASRAMRLERVIERLFD